MSILKFNTDYLKQPLFFGNPVDIARFDVVKYPWIEKLTERQNGFFWRPQEFNLSKDSKDFRPLNKYEQHIFTSNVKRQIVLDSVQGRAPSLALLPICSSPELESFITAWTYFESIHSRSYTYIIRNVYPDPSIIFDGIKDIPEILECGKDISKYYDNLIAITNSSASLYEKKKALWLCLHAINALEGIRFYVSFACSWAFAELNKMEGNAKIIKFIARDENLHLAFTQQLIGTLLKDDIDYNKIKEECQEEVISMFNDVVNQEKVWAEYLFKDGSMIGLNASILSNYVEYLAGKRLTNLGIQHSFSKTDPLPWTRKWISGEGVQVAPQETSVEEYLIGSIKQDVDTNSFKGFEL